MATTFTDKETKLICAMIKNLEAITVDWSATAVETGHANGVSAKRQWDKLKAKHGIAGAGTPAKVNGDAGEGTSKAKATNKRKAGAMESEEEGDEQAEGAALESPAAAKKARTTKSKNKGGLAKIKEELEEACEEEA